MDINILTDMNSNFFFLVVFRDVQESYTWLVSNFPIFMENSFESIADPARENLRNLNPGGEGWREVPGI